MVMIVELSMDCLWIISMTPDKLHAFVVCRATSTWNREATDGLPWIIYRLLLIIYGLPMKYNGLRMECL